MAKHTAVIDLGSNSIRMVIFTKTSRFGFFISKEYKQKIRLAKNCYQDTKELDAANMQEALKALRFFKEMAKKHSCSKILAVGTSALRQIQNSGEFIALIRKECKIDIKCISGPMEGYLGGIAALNLLSPIKNATTIDVGGGSCELCLIKDGLVADCISLELGTVRLKELFGKKKKSLEEHIKKIIQQSIPPKYKNEHIIAIGGSLRAISNSIMKKNSYPFYSIHNFTYKFSQEKNHIHKILSSSSQSLTHFSIKKDRFDTIKEGCMIFLELIRNLKAKYIITSGVGVREGVYLNDMLNKKLHPSKGLKSEQIPSYTPRFTKGFNPSFKALQDRFSLNKSSVSKLCSKLFDILNTEGKLLYKEELILAAKLVYVGEKLSYYYANEHAFYFTINSLAFGYTHEQKVLIAMLLKLNGKKVNDYLIDPFKKLLCGYIHLSTLNFILFVCKQLDDYNDSEVEFVFEDSRLYILKNSEFHSCESDFKKIARPVFVKKVSLIEKP